MGHCHDLNVFLCVSGTEIKRIGMTVHTDPMLIFSA